MEAPGERKQRILAVEQVWQVLTRAEQADMINLISLREKYQDRPDTDTRGGALRLKVQLESC
jgi:hypothetical protein